MKKILWIVMLMMSMTTYAQKTPEIYRIFDAQGKEVSYEKMIKTVSATDVVFFGEIHNCVISHWMELKVLEALTENNKKLKVGMEMLEADNQLIIDEYTSSTISSDRFEEECRLWPNHSTDYEPLVYYAKRHHLPLIATNVPRRYASVVKEKGLMGLLGKAKETKPQLMAQAQAIKDATMGWFIAQNLKKGEQMIHFNGTYHSDARNGIIPYLLEYRPKTTISTIRAVRQEEIDKIEKDYLGLADFYICITEDMNVSY